MGRSAHKPGGDRTQPGRASLRHRLHEIIFEADTPAGKAFDIALIVLILLSVLAVCLESVESFQRSHGVLLRRAEWVFTVLFTIEYVFRLASVRRPLKYATSFFGIIDLVSILPSYLSLLLPGAQSLLVFRSLRLVRVFRVLKLARVVGESQLLVRAIRASMPKITVFLVTVVSLVTIIGAAMYLIEGDESGFTSIPQSIYWTIVTMTTVGYGDIAPQTVTGKFLASIVMVTGYGIIAVPTGIVSAEIAQAARPLGISTQACPNCAHGAHDPDARFCKRCGQPL